MKIAAIIQAHHRPDLLEKLLDRLSGDLWTRHVHVDRKSDIAAFAALPVASLDRISLQARLTEIGQGEGATNRPVVA